jgi:hypothetical protein
MVLPEIKNLLNDPNARVRFYAARTASRLGEVAPTEMFALHAADPDSDYQLAAIEELGRIQHDEKATSLLRKILPSARGGTRIAVYEALHSRSDNAIPTFSVGERFDLEIIHDDGEPMIYATIRGRPRLAILGQSVSVKSPAVFSSPALGLTVKESRDGAGIEVFREVKTPGGGIRYSPPIKCSYMGYSLVGALGRKVDPDYDEKAGLGYNYGQVVGVLYAMCETKKINATFHLQREPLPALELYLPDESTTAGDDDDSAAGRIRDEAQKYDD